MTTRGWQLWLAGILAVIAVTFANVFANGFVGDDHDFIVKWEITKSSEGIGPLILGAVPAGHEGVYRPLRGILYLVMRQAVGVEPLAYHVFSLLVHSMATIAVCLLIAELMRDRQIGLIAGLLFAVHPIHVEAITFVTTSFDVVGIALMLWSMWAYIKWRNSGNQHFLRLSILLYGFSVLTYELTLTMPLLLGLVEWLKLVPTALAQAKLSNETLVLKKPTALTTPSQQIKRVIDTSQISLSSAVLKIHIQKDLGSYFTILIGKKIWPYWAMVGIYGAVRFGILEIAGRSDYQAGSWYHTMLAMSKALVRYFQLLVAPVDLNINHSFSDGLFAHTLLEINAPAVLRLSVFRPDVALSIALLVSLVWFALKAKAHLPWLSLGILWIFVSLLPVMNIWPNASLLHEKYAYLASVGYVLVLAVLWVKLWRMKKYPMFLLAGLIALTSWYGYLTYVRNMDWKSDVVLWEKTVTQSPDNPVVWYMLASAYRDAGDLDLAAEYYEQSLVMYPRFVESMTNLGVIADRKGDLKTAKLWFERGLSIKPGDQLLQSNLQSVTDRLLQ